MILYLFLLNASIGNFSKLYCMLPFATNRFDFDDGISKSEIQKLCANPKIKYIQTRSATTDPIK
ncbi:hypothetical protein LEP1GSC188_3347 [Leptospira weilii serovar Topaz str. LT2116]|uniref:Uncharacterized protein n=2 Tax=Leptospira weilii TaxID=28184 RepID=M3GZ32_9LEPT|nr:hypothetical protein LEP1GSC188_3347 [Leptospira weilii serovar Topaz str. LT2116]EMN44630.1 hypothetical protein LEP1GSC086_1980 [Leptospira weilii str. LNT 1234]EMY13009.1 hypothetical protein LEP1GSC043_4709 [Leptospira weilii str. Ecochallenge]OMI18819.1 hypothetical protein BUQ74_02705 [Leptospira weilii serovar Heyan]QDK25013.1 hypothetical protein FHG67_20150 [Leptospira weilii]